ncbi:NifU family protein [Actinomycetota bacterium]
METSSNIVEITEIALEQILELRELEAVPNLTLGLRVAGVGANGFVYETAFTRSEDVAESDHKEEHGDLPVAIPQTSLDQLRGSVLDITESGGLVIRNPNPATPQLATEGPAIELTGTVEERITQLLDDHINPSIASHGGYVRLLDVDGSTAQLEMGGGCQGCGLAAMTLRDGIQAAILHNIPEIEEIVDATDHMAGTNPYY